jgi:hypothetical protein
MRSRGGPVGFARPQALDGAPERRCVAAATGRDDHHAGDQQNSSHDDEPAVGITVDDSVVRIDDEVHMTALVATERT